MKNQREIYRALLDNKTLIAKTSREKILVRIGDDGNLLTKRNEDKWEDGDGWEFYNPDEWSIYEPPKEKKKITILTMGDIADGQVLQVVKGSLLHSKYSDTWKRIKEETIEVDCE